MLILNAERKDVDTGSRVELTLTGSAAPPQLQDQPIFFELDGSDAADLELLDGFAGAVIHCAMERRQPLHINGRLSRKCLRHLRRYQQFWSRIHSERYVPIPITAEEIVKDQGDTRDLPAVAAYSGGVDSSFSVLRHALRLSGIDSHPLQAVATVHGFDVLLADEAGFKRRIERLKPAIEELGLDRYVVRTNIKELIIQDWIKSYPTQLVACLHMLGHRYSKALVASDGYAQCPDFEFGGNAISIPLLTTSRLKVFYEGGESGRTDKAILIANYPTVLRSLKFCWEGPDADRNCGKCRGCILTYMNLRAAGVERPDCSTHPSTKASSAIFRSSILQALPSATNSLSICGGSRSLRNLRTGSVRTSCALTNKRRDRRLQPSQPKRPSTKTRPPHRSTLKAKSLPTRSRR